MEGKEVALLAELSRLYHERQTGELEVRGEGFRKRIYIEQGRIVFAVSDLEQDSLGNILVDAEKITQEQLAEALSLQAKDPSAMLGTVLVWKGFISPEDLYWGIKFQATRIIYGLFQLEGYDHEFNAKPLGREDVLRLNFQTPNIIMEGARRMGSLSRLRQVFPPKAFVRIKSEVEQSKLVDLLPREREVLPLLNGRYSVQKLIGLGLMDELELLRMLNGLLSLRLLTVAGEAAHAEPIVLQAPPAREPGAATESRQEQDLFFRLEADRLRQLDRFERGRKWVRGAVVAGGTAIAAALLLYAMLGRPRQSPVEAPPLPIGRPTPASSAAPVPAAPANVGGSSSAPPQADVPPPPEPSVTRPLLVDGFRSESGGEGHLRVSFRLASTAGEGAEQRGYLFIAAERDAGKLEILYPEISKPIDISIDYRRGVPYRISRFKQVETRFPVASIPDSLTVVAIDREGHEQLRQRVQVTSR